MGGTALAACMALLSRTPTAGVLAKLSIEGGPGDDIIRVARFLSRMPFDFVLNKFWKSSVYSSVQKISKVLSPFSSTFGRKRRNLETLVVISS